MAGKKEVCSICGKSVSEVNKMIKTSQACYCNECVQEMYDVCFANEKEEFTEDCCNVTPSQIKAHLDQYVIGQDNAKMALSVAVYNHYKRLRNNSNRNREVEIQKSNILLLGSTGSGKTYLAQTLAKFLGVPFVIADATTLTEAGYVGDDVENILTRLLENADYDVAMAERGIIYIDEIDKIARLSENRSITRDVSGEGVQQALLKILEGTVSQISPSSRRKNPQAETIPINTTNILFICGGAFEGIEKIIDKDAEHKSIGFNTDIVTTTTKNANIDDVQPEDIVKFGLMPELVGRLPVITTLNPLCENDLVHILTKPKNALVKQYEELFAMDGIKLEFSDDAIQKIAELAYKKKIGARGLRSIIEKAMQKIMFTVPDMANARKVVISKEVIEGETDAVVYGQRNKKIA